MYRTFLLDIDNTLLDFDAAEKRGFIKGIESYEIEYNREMLDQYKKINRNLWSLLEQGKIEKEELLNTRFGEFFRLYHIEANGIEAESRFRRHLGESADLIPNAKETLLEHLTAYMILKYKGLKMPVSMIFSMECSYRKKWDMRNQLFHFLSIAFIIFRTLKKKRQLWWGTAYPLIFRGQ